MIFNTRYLGALVGNMMQFYDFTIYAFLTTEIGKTFFNFHNPFLSQLVVFSIFAGGYLSRPLGTVIFGYLGDKKGRSHALSKTIILSAAATFAIGIIPSVQSIGFLAPLLLVTLRLIQGIAVSGEEGGAVVLLFEQASFKNTGVIGGAVLSSVLVGILLGVLVCALTHLQSVVYFLGDEAWRLPFILSLPLGIFAILCRFYLNDFELFARVKESKLIVQHPFWVLFDEHLLALLYGFCIVAVYSLTTSVLIVHMPYYLNTHLELSHGVSLGIVAAMILFLALSMPVIGRYCDRYSPQAVYHVGVLGIIIFSPLMFHALAQGGVFYILESVFIFSGFTACISSAIFSILVGLFPFGVRYSGVSLAFNMSITVFSSTTPLVLMLLENYSHYPYAPGVYISTMALLTWIVSLVIRQKIPIIRFNESKKEQFIYQEKS